MAKVFNELTVGQTLYIISLFTDKIAYFIEQITSISIDDKFSYERLFISTQNFHFNDVHKYMSKYKTDKCYIFTDKDEFVETCLELLMKKNDELSESEDLSNKEIIKHNHHLMRELVKL